MIVLQLFPMLPDGFEASPRIHLGPFFEIDVAAFESEDVEVNESTTLDIDGGGTAIAALPKPTLSVESDLLEQDEYEVRVYDALQGRRLVAAIELVSPGNKDRPSHRQAFVAKCRALLQQGVSVSIVDLVTIGETNLYTEMLQQLGHDDPTMGRGSLYAATCRTRANGKKGRLETWSFPLTIGQPLPSLPIFLSTELMIMLDLETSYEETCRVLKLR
jgi:hypothetical protein